MRSLPCLVSSFALLVAAAPAARAQVPITAFGAPVSQDFNGLAASGTGALLPTGWALREVGSGANTTYTAGDGAAASGDTYSFGAASGPDRALGAVRSDAVASIFGARYVNATGGALQSLTVAYSGEAWRLGTADRADRLDFQYSLDATSLADGTWIDVDALDFATPTTSGAPGARDGNTAAQRTALSASITGLAVPAGQTFWLRWSDVDATGEDDGLAIDDVVVTAQGVPGPGFTLRRSLAVQGSYALVGNVILDCTLSPCPAGNNGTPFDYVDADDDPTTRGSSSATLDLPAGATPRAAYLLVTIYGSEQAPPNARWADGLGVDDVSVRFKGPEAADYTLLAPEDVSVDDTGIGYQGLYDVSALVAGEGAYWVADPPRYPDTSSYNGVGNWVLVVVYDEPGAPTQLVNLYDGVQACFRSSFSVPIAGFETPSLGTVQGQLSIVAGDGASSAGGDSVTLGAFSVANATNPSNNIGNNTVSGVDGAAFPRVPSAFNATDELVDIDTFDVTGAFANNATSTTATFSCGDDGVIWHGLVLALDIKAPAITVTKDASVSAPVGPGDIFEYAISVENAADSPENARALVVSDVLPAGLVPLDAGFVFDAGGGAVTLTTAADGDAGEIVAGVVTVRVGDLFVGGTASVRFAVQVADDVANGTLSNVAVASYRGVSSDSPITTASVATLVDAVGCVVTGDDTDCDGDDDDCDGRADSGFVGAPDACGVGACAAVGVTTCTGGVLGTTCLEGPQTGDDTDCDGVDDDCDGGSDDGFVGGPDTCGVGACAAAGTTTCTRGVLGTTCVEGPQTGDDTDCDGVDDDCDGDSDDGFVGAPDTCGVGACAATGTTTCAGGVPGTTCAVGPQTGADTDCDGVDDDCDGTADDGFVPRDEACGDAQCGGSARVTCADGEEVRAACVPAEDGTLCGAGPCALAAECQAGACVVTRYRSCDDGDPCTIDTCDAAVGCTAATVEDGEPCDDGNACTPESACADGACVGDAPACPPPGRCEGIGLCNADTGACEYPVEPGCEACGPGDVLAPELTCPTPVVVPCGGVVTEVALAAASARDACGAVQVVSDAPVLFPLGVTVVTFTGTDLVGNSASCTTTVTVEDDVPPTLLCPEDTAVEAPSGICGADVTQVPSVIDGCDAAPTVLGQTTGFYAPGTTEVQFFALDASGNQASCTTTVTVTGLDELVIACEPALTVAAPPDVCGYPERLVAEAIDVCHSVTEVTSAVERFPIGVTDVTFSAARDGEPAVTCTTALTVEDVTAPSIDCGPDGAVDLTTVFAPVVADACGFEQVIDALRCERDGVAVAERCVASEDDVAVKVDDAPASEGGEVEVVFDVTATDPSGNTTTVTCRLAVDPESLDHDHDTIPDRDDNCPTVPNVDQLDTDLDTLGDACDPTGFDELIAQGSGCGAAEGGAAGGALVGLLLAGLVLARRAARV